MICPLISRFLVGFQFFIDTIWIICSLGEVFNRKLRESHSGVCYSPPPHPQAFRILWNLLKIVWDPDMSEAKSLSAYCLPPPSGFLPQEAPRDPRLRSAVIERLFYVFVHLMGSSEDDRNEYMKFSIFPLIFFNCMS